MKDKILYFNIITTFIILIISIICFSILNLINPIISQADIDNLNENQIYVGYSKVCINPNPEDGPIPLAGYGNTYNRVAKFEEGEQEYQQDLYATAVAMKDHNDNIIIFVTCDLVALGKARCNEIIENIERETQIDSKRIMISCTHTHSAPDVGFSNSKYPELNASVLKYRELLKNRITEACSEAINNFKLSNAYIKTINIIREDGKNALNFVRHYETNDYYQDGSKIYKGDNHGQAYWINGVLKYSESTRHVSTADSTMQLIKFNIENDKDILMVNWQTHPHITGGSLKKTISADFIASFRDEVEEKCNCKVAYYTGAAGNVNWMTDINDGSQGGIEGLSYNYDKSTDEIAYKTSINFGKKLASYVINDNNYYENVKMDRINIEQRKIKLNLKKEKNENLYNNAKFVKLIWDSNLNDIAKMIEGTYEYGSDFVFPSGYDSSGAGLREIVELNNLLRNSFIINEVDGKITCHVAEGTQLNAKTRLILYLETRFEDRIQSPYHADAVIRNYLREEGTTQEIELSTITIGDISFATVPDEIFDTNGKYVKDKSSSKMTFVLELTNGSYGYIPSELACEYGCYENDTTNFAEGSGEQVANELLSMLAEELLQVNTQYTAADNNTGVIVTVTANKEIKEIPGWTLSTDKKSLTKTYTQYTKENIKIYDLVDNSVNVTVEAMKLSNIQVKTKPDKESYIEGENFDKTGMKIEAIYNDVAIKEITDYVIIDGDNLPLEKTNITINYTEGEITKTTTQEINVLEKLKLNIEDYSVMDVNEKRYLLNIQPQITIENFLNKLETNGTIKIIKDEIEIMNYEGKISTGMKIQISLNNEIQEYTIVVKGDTNGDGKSDIKDILKINKHRLNRSQLKEGYLQAGDVNNDGKADIKDILRINKYRLNKITNF